MPESTPSSPRPLRILHTIASSKWTGAAEPMGHMARSQSEAGHHVLVAITHGKNLKGELEALGLWVDDTVDFTDNAYGPRALRDLLRLRRLILEERIDIVHAHMTRDHIAAALAIRLLPRSHRPVLIRSVHREIPLRANALVRALQISPTNGFTAPSETQRAAIAREWGVPPEAVLTWRAEVDTARFHPDPQAGLAFREKFGIPRDAVTFGLVSRLRDARGVDWLIEGAEGALARNPDLWIVIAGRGNGEPRMHELIARSAHAGRLRHVGYISGPDLEGGYNSFDCALLMKPGSDGACRGAVQAMACGKPVVAGDVGSLRDLFAEGQCGWVVPVDDRAALAETLLAVAADPEARRQRGENALRRAREDHPLRSQTGRFIEFYRQRMERAAS